MVGHIPRLEWFTVLRFGRKIISTESENKIFPSGLTCFASHVSSCALRVGFPCRKRMPVVRMVPASESRSSSVIWVGWGRLNWRRMGDSIHSGAVVRKNPHTVYIPERREKLNLVGQIFFCWAVSTAGHPCSKHGFLLGYFLRLLTLFVAVARGCLSLDGLA